MPQTRVGCPIDYDRPEVASRTHFKPVGKRHLSGTLIRPITARSGTPLNSFSCYEYTEMFLKTKGLLYRPPHVPALLCDTG